ncbi:glutathione S-transferase T1-like [Phalaenopsis equestris]|uniref:glutathione S-transferase T1-like n=1 Tax=Phalaenopsis equestris TaxID=78828 RepID=UPI0009E496DC|nr:glutathione S-transferase T1-like [Phalaenopsis equestris]
MTLKVYANRLSQPSRAIIIFCKVNGVDFEEISIDLLKGEHKSPEYKEINPMAQVPAIVDDGLKLSESHTILRYIAETSPGVPDNWYPADFISRAKVNSILDWHHSNLRVSSVTFVMNTVLAPKFGRTMNPQAAAEAEKSLSSSLSIIESMWLNGDAEFFLGNPKPSIADLSLVCEITQSELWREGDRERILRPHPKILQWVENVKKATNPYFDEVHEALYKMKALLKAKQSE